MVAFQDDNRLDANVSQAFTCVTFAEDPLATQQVTLLRSQESVWGETNGAETPAHFQTS